MYYSIKYAILHLHPGQDVDSNTISKTTAVYENDYFIFDEKEIKDLGSSSKEIQSSVRKKSKLAKEYEPLVNQFKWHLN